MFEAATRETPVWKIFHIGDKPLFVNRGNGQIVRFDEPYFLRFPPAQWPASKAATSSTQSTGLSDAGDWARPYPWVRASRSSICAIRWVGEIIRPSCS